MKQLLIIFLSILFFSCNPFISKDLRRKNKCNRKLERIERINNKKIAKLSVYCPEILKIDTLRDTLIVQIPEVNIDSFIIIQKDTAEIDSLLRLIRNKKTKKIIRKYITNYVPLKDTIIHQIDGYTFKFFNLDGNIAYRVYRPREVIEKTSEIVIKKTEKIKLTTGEKIMNWISSFWWLIFVSVIAFLLMKFAYKRLF